MFDHFVGLALKGLSDISKQREREKIGPDFSFCPGPKSIFINSFEVLVWRGEMFPKFLNALLYFFILGAGAKGINY